MLAVRSTSFAIDDNWYLASPSLIRDKQVDSVCAKVGVFLMGCLVTSTDPSLPFDALVPVSTFVMLWDTTPGKANLVSNRFPVLLRFGFCSVHLE